MVSKSIIIDSDLVNDDALAILLALQTSSLDIHGITIVAGAVGLGQGLKNALNILEIANRTSIPVYPGAEKPLFRDLVTGKTFHGTDGLGNLNLPLPSIHPNSSSALAFIIDQTLSVEISPTIITLGPLTNIAGALLLQPSIRDHIKEIVMVGGSIFAAGNYTPSITANCPRSEYNFFVDPEAAQIIFSSGIPLVMVGMDVTEKVLLTERLCEEIAAANPSKITSFVCATTQPYMQVHQKVLGLKGCYIADPLAVVYVIDPTAFETRELYVQIETKGEITRGETVADLANLLGKESNVRVCIDVNEKKVLQLFFNSFVPHNED